MRKEFEYINHLAEIDHITSRLVIGAVKDDSAPLVSVLMPVYNHPGFFRKSLLSVLNQKCDFEYEIVIIDNCHPDFQPRNQKIIEELYCDKIRYYINEENIGGVGSENRGIQLAKAEYITYCHDDDLLTEDALQTLISEIRRCSNPYPAIFGTVDMIDENDAPLKNVIEWDYWLLLGKQRYKVDMYDMLLRNYTNGCGSLYHREKLLELGGFNNDYVPCPDYALNVKYVSLYGAFSIKKITLNYRVTPQGDCSTAYQYIVDANKKIKENILMSGYISRLFPRFLIKANLKVERYHLYDRWDKNKPSAWKYFFYRIVNKSWIYSMLVMKRFFK